MIHLFPYLEEHINSEKTPEDIYSILESITDSKKITFSTNAEFIGQVHLFDFEIFPKLGYRNSFLPIITGNIIKNEYGSVINITLQMHMFTRIFLTFWFSMTYFYFLIGIFLIFVYGLEKITVILISVGFNIFAQILMRSGFYNPAQKVLKRLKELLC